ncbi:MAG: molybdopterin-dependent oxidoreductase [Chloroflexi bacterium]|nr:molybdopterin-dependent oxidoreductase [Chloroflexota bacterium]
MQTTAQRPSTAGEKWVTSVCKMCLHGCGIRVRVKDGVVLKVEGDPTNPDNLGKLCAKGHAGIMRHYDPHRFKSPLKRTNPEKGPGVDPKWQEISWDEAFAIVAEKLGEIRRTDPRKLIVSISDFQRGYNWGWGAMFGSNNFMSSTGQYCGAAYHPINGMIDGSFAGVNDYAYCNYWIQIGCGDGFSSHLHFAGSAKRMADARVNRGMKVVVVEPRLSQAGAKADEWIPIRPATDRAFVLGMMHVLVHELGIYDRQFLKRHTNAPYLVDSDGNYVRDRATGKVLIWDPVDGRAKNFDDVTIEDFALEGNFVANGVPCRSGFQVFKNVLAEHPPERMSEICTVPAATIRRIATEFGEAARIGSTITIDGVELPYRPAAINFYRGAIAHVDGGFNTLTYKLMNMLVGNIDVPGGHLGVPLDTRGFWISPGEDGMLEPHVHPIRSPHMFSFPPNSSQLREYFPIGWEAGSVNSVTILDPEKYHLEFVPEAMLLYHSNPMWNLPATKKVQQVFAKMKFIAVIDVMPNEANEWADVVLPDHSYLESYAPVSCEPPVVCGYALRQPVVLPMYNTMDATDILSELAERLGFLGGWNDSLNLMFALVRNPKYLLAPDKKYTIEEMTDRVSRAWHGDECGLEWLKEKGHAVRHKTVKEQYMPYGKLRIPFYFEFVKRTGDELKRDLEKHGVEWDCSSYSPLPYWRSSPVHDAPPPYDLYAISFKTPELNFAESATIPWLYELMHKIPAHMGVLINPATAKARGIADGDPILVESCEDSLEGVAKLTEGVHPEVVAISNAKTRWVKHPTIKYAPTHFNALLPTSLEYVDGFTGCIETTARVAVRKLEG